MRNGPYIMIKAPADYPGKLYRNKYAYEHRVVYWQNTGLVSDYNYTIHHINADKHDNHFENLELISRSAHAKEHGREVTIRCQVLLKCFGCACDFHRKGNQYRERLKRSSNYRNSYCTRACYIKHCNKLAI